MTKYVVPIQLDGTYYVADVNKKRDLPLWFGTFVVYGNGGANFGSGTLTYYLSPDNGVTFVPLKDASGTTITSTANDNFTLNLAAGAKSSDAPKLYVGLSGSTNPNITVVLYDNNG